jgi:serine/tyrosine/threonine adenylyltransferase
MHQLGIPGSRSLAVVFTGLPVYREEVHPGAVLSRVAMSHIRIGTFEYARQFLNKEALMKLLDYSIQRHYSHIALEDPDKASLFLHAVMQRQIQLVCQWMRVGFIHGVMNTDNITISGETLDYGPCAFINQYDPATVFSSIDSEGRYRFGNQGAINHWNLSILGGAILPLIDENQELALEKAKTILAAYKPLFETSYYNTMAAKLGISDGAEQKVRLLIDELLHWMHANEADYTNTFLYLQDTAGPDTSIYDKDSFLNWQNSYKTCLSGKNIAEESRMALMKASNPVYIPRNHLVEEALDEVYSSGKLQKLHQLWRLMLHPYRPQQQAESYMQVPPKDENYRTFCGT